MPTIMTDAAVVIRHATAADADQLMRVAGRDSQRPVHGPTLVAEVGGVACAALQLADGRVIADPFLPTADLVALLRLRAQAIGRGSAAGAWRPRPGRYRVRLAMLALSAAAVLSYVVPAAAGGVISSASGSGHITSGDQNRTFAFTARQHADGTVKGQAQVISRALETIAHMEIDCLRVVGNVAHMSGVVTHSSRPEEAQVGEMRRFVVEDNGEGSKGAPDLISTIPVNPTGETCQDSSLSPTRPVERGNVKVR